MAKTDDYTPPEVWTWDAENGGRFASINRPIAGATHDNCRWRASVSALFAGNLNGAKVTIMFEELLALGFKEAEYDAWLIRIEQGDRFSSGFVSINPNSKSSPDGLFKQNQRNIFESGAILLYFRKI